MGRPAKIKDKKQIIKEKLKQRKKESKKNKHRARLVVKNLPFTATEESLRQHFEQYGEVDDVKVLKNEDGKTLGCGFVQFKLVQKAAKARHHLNGKPFLNRNIECDWAVPKSKYKSQQVDVKIKTEPPDSGYENSEIKTDVVEIKEEALDQDEAMDIEEKYNKHVKSEEEEEDATDDDDDDREAEVHEEEDKKHIKAEDEDTKDVKGRKPFVESNDATEGKTVFVKNVPFNATKDDLKQCFVKYGPLYYALVCIDPLTEHSKGTGFVKFRNKEDADSCMQTQNVILNGNTLECQFAITRGELQNNKDGSNKKARQKDTRNLYLVKEGVVLAGTKAAEGVSAADMAKRLQIEQYKTQMLRNLNMIVARTRVIIHNLPPDFDDAKLRALFKKYSSPGAVMKEAKIMRNMKLVDGMGVGKSKEYGFVTFMLHEHALEALRAINNNPNVFTSHKRPIVAFSIENRAKLQAKQRRLHNSQVKNPKNKLYDPKAPRFKPRNKNEEAVRGSNDDATTEMKEFSGVAATPGVSKMRSRYKLQTQAKIHQEQLKKAKREKKFAKKTLEQKRAEFTKQPRQKINRKAQESDDFSKLVNEYKKKLYNAPRGQEKKKWFE